MIERIAFLNATHFVRSTIGKQTAFVFVQSHDSDSSDDDDFVQGDGEDPAYMVDQSSGQHLREFQLQDASSLNNIKIEEPISKPHDSHDDLVKMTPAGFETEFPRKDNYFMTK